MRMCPHHRYGKLLSGINIRGRDTAGNNRCAGTVNARIRPLRTTKTELHNPVTLCRMNHPCRLCSNQGLMIDNVQNRRFNKLCFYNRRNHFYERFLRKDHRSLRYRIDVSRKMETAEIIDKIFFKNMEAAKIINIFFIEV